MTSFPQTDYFKHTRQRPDRAEIKDEWIELVIRHPETEQIQSDGRIRRWARIPAFANRALRVIFFKGGVTPSRLWRTPPRPWTEFAASGRVFASPSGNYRRKPLLGRPVAR